MAVLQPSQWSNLTRAPKKSTQNLAAESPWSAFDVGKNSFRVVGHDQRGAIVLRQKWSRGQVQARLANLLPCLIGMEACIGAHHLSRKLQAFGHNARLMPAGLRSGETGMSSSGASKGTFSVDRA